MIVLIFLYKITHFDQLTIYRFVIDIIDSLIGVETFGPSLSFSKSIYVVHVRNPFKDLEFVAKKFHMCLT